MSCNSINKEEICKNVDLSHLINKLVGKLGEDEVKKLLLNATSDCLEKDGSNVISDDKVKETTSNKALNVVNKKDKFEDKKEADIQNFNTNQIKESGEKELSIDSNQKLSSNCNFQEDSNINVKSSNESRDSLRKQKSNINRNLLSSFIEVDNLKQKYNQNCVKKVSIKQKKSLNKSCVKQCKESDLLSDLCSSHFTESENTSHTNSTNESNLSTNMRIDKNSVVNCVNQSDNDTLNLSDKNKSESTKRKSKNRVEKASPKNKEKTVSEKINKSETCSEFSETKIRKCEHKKSNFVKNDKNLKRNNKPEESTDFGLLEEEKNLSKDTPRSEDALCENNVSTENKSNTRKRKLKRDNFSSEPRILRFRKDKQSCVSDDENTCNYSTNDKKDKSNISCENTDASQAKQIIVESKLNVSSDDINNEIEENSKSLQESINNQQNYKTELKEVNIKKNNQKNIGKKQMKEQNNESEQIIMSKEENFIDQQQLDSKKNLKKKISNENTNLSKFSKPKTLKKTSSTDEIQIVNKEKSEIEKQCSNKSIEKTNVKMKNILIENSIIVKPCSVILKKENLEKELIKINILENNINKEKVKTFKNQENNKLNNIVTNNYSLELNQEKKDILNKKEREKIIKLNRNNNLLNLNNVPEKKIKDKSVIKNETKKQKAKEVKNKEKCSLKKFDDDDDNQQSENDSMSLRKEQFLNLQTEKLPINENEQTINDKNLNNVPENKIKDKSVEKNETKKQKAKEVKTKEECSSKKFDEDNPQSENDSVSFRKEQSLNLQIEKLPVNENEQTNNDKNLSNVPETKIKDKSVKKNEINKQKTKEVKIKEECLSKKFDDNNQQSENDSVSLRNEQSLKHKRCKKESISLQTKKLPINENEQTISDKNLSNVPETKIKSVEKNVTKRQRGKKVKTKEECSSKKFDDDNPPSENDSVSLRKEQSLNSQTEKLPVIEIEQTINDKNLNNVPENKIKDESVEKNVTKRQRGKKVKTKEECSSKKFDDDNPPSENDSVSLRKEQSLNSQTEKLPVIEIEQINNDKNLSNVSETKIKDKSVERNKTKKQKAKEVENKEECSSKKIDDDNQQSENNSVSLKKEQSLNLQIEKLPINENEQINNEELKIKDKRPDDKDIPTIGGSFEKNSGQDFISEKKISVDKKNKIRKLRRLDINKKSDKYSVKQKSELIESKESTKPLLENTVDVNKNDEYKKNKKDLKNNERKENYVKEQFKEKLKHHLINGNEVTESQFSNNENEQDSNNKIKDKTINSPDHQNLNLERKQSTYVKNKSSKSLQQLTELHSKIKCVSESIALAIGKDSSDSETNEIDKCENSSNNNTNSSKFVCSMEKDSSDNETNKIDKCENSSNNITNSSKSVCSMEKDSSVDNTDKNIKNDEHSSKVYENKKKHKIKFEEENLCKKKLKISKTEEQIKEKHKMSQSKQGIETDKTTKQMKKNDIFANKQNSINKSVPIQKRKLKRNNSIESKKNVQIKQNLSNSLIENNEDNSSLPPSLLLPEEKTASNNMESNKTDSFVKLSNDKNVDDHASEKNNIKTITSETNDIKCKKKKLKDKPLHKDVNKKEVNAEFINEKNILITKDLSSQSSKRKIVIIKKEPLKSNNDENLKKSENTKTEISINDDRNNNFMESSTEYSSNATKQREPKIFKESTITKPKNILNKEESLETKFNENLSSPKFSNSQKPKMIANIKERMELELKTEGKSPETISLKNFNNGSCDNPEYSDSSSQIIHPIKKKSNKKSFQTEDCDNHIESNHFSQDFITNKINIDNNFEPVITDIRHVPRSEWESPEKQSENNVSADSDENQNSNKLNNKTIYQDSENSDASNEEAHDEYSELREQFTNAGIKLEDAVSFIDVEKLKEMVINAGNDSCVLLRRAHYCPHSKQQVGPSLIVVKSHKKFMETKDAILCKKYGMKRCKVVLNELS